jgi:precorrin-6A/cobalt-precorrin-6A reductase
MAFKVLILGGTAEGRLLAERLAHDARFDSLLSYAGRTASLAPPDVPHRVGGFGGVAGLAEFLQRGGFAALMDLTHPFAARISANAVEAARIAGTPLVVLERATWQQLPADRWIEVADMAEAARALGSEPRRVFLTIGRLELQAFEAAPQHQYLIRAVDAFALPSALPRARLLSARGPFQVAGECALLEREGIELLVSKNSGTPATYAKIEAARLLRLPVVMVQRPPMPACARGDARGFAQAQRVQTLDAALAWLETLHGAGSSRRGE